MITVSISINGEPIFTRSVKNQSKTNTKNQTLYITDANDKIWHEQSEGAIELAKKMLDTIKLENI